MKAKDLRNSILQMAVQGKLVSQDPNDEPASVLLERIRAERRKLIAEKKIKAPKGGESIIFRASDGLHYENTSSNSPSLRSVSPPPSLREDTTSTPSLRGGRFASDEAISSGTWFEQRFDAKGKPLGEPVCIDDEIPFDIPDTWEWSRFDGYLDVRDGTHDTPKYVSEGFMLVTSKNLTEQGILDFTDVKLISEEDHRKIQARSKVDEGDILFAMIGSIGNPVLVKGDTDFSIKNMALFKRTLLSMSMEYVLFYLDAIQTTLEKTASGGVQKFLSLKFFRNLLIPVPPQQEQERIVQKIEELLPFVDEYGALEDAREQLDAELPERLHKSVLQLAVQGKLVPQDSNDEPASVLLDRIRAERKKLIAEKKIKSPKGGESVIFRGSDGCHYENTSASSSSLREDTTSTPSLRGGRFASDEAISPGTWFEQRFDAKGKPLGEPVCIDDEIPFDIPTTWQWVRLGEIGDWKAGATPTKGESRYYSDGTVPWLLTGDLNDNLVTEIPNSITEVALRECSVRLNPVGSVLVAMYGATIGKIGVLGIAATTNQACCSCILHDTRIREWLVTWLRYQKPHFIKMGEGGAQPNISRQKIVGCLFPLPPLPEQKRIVSAVNRVFTEITSR